ncbi:MULTISPECIES: trypsin-like peptidase domain-containing protein [unclassified Bradyrhizobium]|nr:MULTISPECIES: trypsin-like peptidase domain-containing protein [unclassified Bradyrhizobium]
MIPGIDFGEFQEALVAAFNPRELEMMVRVRLNERLEDIVTPGPNNYVAFQLIDWAERKGATIVVDLARAAYLTKPDHEKIRRLYEKFGMAPTMSVQNAGKSVTAAPERATASGLEAIVRPRLKTFDMGVWRGCMAQIEGQVCRIEFDGNAMGTGFLIGPDLILTNYHVLESAIEGTARPAAIACHFDYKVLTDGSRSEGVVVPLHDSDWRIDFARYSQAEAEGQPDRDLPAVDELDFVLARLARSIGNEPIDKNAGSGAPRRRWIAMPKTQPPLEIDMPLLIAQHPDGSPLKLAVDTQAVLGVNGNGTRVRYATNSDRGSSGSPCFNMEWSLVAMHHMGDPAWGSPKFNQGIPIGMIRQRLAGKIEFEAP